MEFESPDLQTWIPIGELLQAEGKLKARDLERALVAQREMGGLLGQVLVKLGVLSEVDVAQALSRQLRIPLILAGEFPDDLCAVDGLAKEFLVGFSLLPLSVIEGVLQVAMAVPQDQYAAKALSLASGLKLRPLLGVESEIQERLRRFFEANTEGDEDGFDFGGEGENEFIEHLKDLASEAPVIQQVNAMIAKAVDTRASDIHIEPFEAALHVRYRVDGVLLKPEEVEQALAPAITSRVKLLARLNIAERRLPQDGRIRTRVKGHELDLRVSTLPTVYGESVVMRVLDRQSIRFSLQEMGFSADTLEAYGELLARPHGILLVTGPTGSGKTTTLYASLATVDAASQKVLTVEDPVEYQLAGINQIQVQSSIGLTFAGALRSILRQDPDIIMIGEMRDSETAQIAVQSALTGHLVLSTLHTNTAAGAIVRLEDMGVERYLITSTVTGVLAQRLVRRLCPHCREERDATLELIEKTGLRRFLAPGQQTIHAAKGCPACKFSGYLGRAAVHELFALNAPMRAAILEGADATTLQQIARREGMLTLYEDGLRKVAAGITSLEEVLRVTQDQGDV